jgi:hypothetical protein
MAALRGSLFAVLLYDVSEEILLERLRPNSAAGTAGAGPERGAALRGPSPDYVRFARPPVVLAAGPARIDGGHECAATVKFFDYGVVSVTLELLFEGDWDDAVALCSSWMGSAALERKTLEIARLYVGRASGAIVKPYESWTSEDYYVLHVLEARDDAGRPLIAHEMVEHFGGRIAQIVRGESALLSSHEEEEILRQRISYYPTDLLVVGWMAAFVYDNAEGAASALQLLEYANTQLIEFRYYDDVLSTVLAGVYRTLERRRGSLDRWRLAKEARRLNRIRLEVIELTERVDNSIKFLSDMFYARAYRIAAQKVGVTDYRDLVDEKLKIAADLYESMVNEFHQGRAFILEAMVVAILLIELGYLFTGHR